MSYQIRSLGTPYIIRYRGSTTATSSPRSTRAAGKEPSTSASPPVLTNGAASEATIRIRDIGKKSEVRRQNSEYKEPGARRQEPGGRSQEPEVRSQESEVRRCFWT